MSTLDSISIPLGWTSERFDRHFTKEKRTDCPDEQPLSVFLGAGVVPRASREDNHNRLGADLAKYQLVEPGDLVFNRLRTWQGGFGASSHRGIVSPAYIVSRPHETVDSKFVHYLLLSSTYLAELTRVSKFMPPSQFDILWADLRTIPLITPPVPRQKAIAAFLDRKTAAIDTLIEKKQKLLDLLAEKRAALINQAVTKGLDPTVPMKDSGIPWIGQIPAHWEVLPIRRVTRRIEQGWSPLCENRLADPGEWGVLKVGCVNGGRFRGSEHKALPADLRPDPRLEIRPGDLLMSRANTSELVGSTAIAVEPEPRLLLCDKLYRIQLDERRCLAGFFKLTMASAALRMQFEATSSGASNSMQNIGQGSLLGFLMAIPPLAEQSDIDTYLTEFHIGSMALEEKLHAHIERLQEYRQALITAAVTGQLAIPEPETRAP